MDEATSALDPESQAMLMEKLAERLPKTAIISVGHRPELEAFHERKVNLVRREGGAKLMTGEVVAPPISILSQLMKRWRAPAGRLARDAHGNGRGANPAAARRLGRVRWASCFSSPARRAARLRIRRYS